MAVIKRMYGVQYKALATGYAQVRNGRRAAARRRDRR